MSDDEQSYERGRSYSSVEITRMIKRGDHRARPTPATQKFAEQLLANVAQFEAERRQEIRAAAKAEAELLAGEVAADYEQPPVEAELTLAEAGRIRRAAKVAEAALPRLVVEADADGMTAPQITEALAVTPSYTYRILREWVKYEWRLDLYDSEAGAGWQSWEAGEDVVERKKVNEVALAERVLAEAGRGPREHRARVLVWERTAGEDEQALYTHEQAPESAPVEPWDAFWTVERREGDDWTEQAAPSRQNVTQHPAAYARFLLAGEQQARPEATLRVRVWRFGTSDEQPPLAEATTGQS
ncbi:hypothetical protein [Streptomyces sp. NPDC047070]|uniref:hypothetical protein n=1 Tax=Streptomyces sp. NPDC047070 TaxID=3154923 RepID=UPI00345519D1